MAFTFSETNIRDNQIVFIYEECACPGVRKIAGKVRGDIEKVFGAKPIGVEYSDFHDTAAFYSFPVFFGTVGQSEILDDLATIGAVDLFATAGEIEVYSLTVVDDLDFKGFRFESAIVIAGSDKRGTIYGLFKLSELLGVSPFVDWLDIMPRRLAEYTLSHDDSFVSKSPSVRYRGFFINDEWPAFGNFCNRSYGGFNSKVYEHVFELLLRLKGNYLWPAMWSATFYDDGPGDANARLADELGIVMGTSHHEPCMRQGEEYSRLRGPQSPYGDAWDFRTNRDGITAFWKDSLAERSRYENVVTVGMRGEADTPILSAGSSMADNVSLLRDIINVQNNLIEECYGKDVDEVPRMLALYKEVEPYYYGDDRTAGLKGDPALDGVTILLCDDNFGNLRHVPTKEERAHRGGYGMYYHFDYHGLPVSYEWFNTTYLPKVWEQMTSAYDNGIRDIWIVNVGDIFSNEYPLAFFLDLAYDFDRWGTSDKNSAEKYTYYFTEQNLTLLNEDERKEAAELLLGYTRITYCRRTEAMNEHVYAPFGESDAVLETIDDLMQRARSLYKALKDDAAFAFYETVYLPLTAALNVQKMWILTAKNHAYANMGSTVADSLADEINDCIKKDGKIVEKLHSIRKGKWYGMGLSEHIGFKHWCEEECQYPIVYTFKPASKPRLIVSIPSTGEHTEGGFWSGKELTAVDALAPSCNSVEIELSTASSGKVSYKISSDDAFIRIRKPEGSASCKEPVKVIIDVDRSAIADTKTRAAGKVIVESGDKKTVVNIPIALGTARQTDEKNVYIADENGVICINAENYADRKDTASGAFEVIRRLGRSGSAIKAFPQDNEFEPSDAPTVTYRFSAGSSGMYNVRLYTTPSNPWYGNGKKAFFISANGSERIIADMIPEGFAVGDGNKAWEKGVLENIHVKDVPVRLEEGECTLTIGTLSPGFVLEKIVIYPEGYELPYSYLGPSESIHS